MRLAQALAGVTQIGFDTSPFIYYVEGNPTHFAVCDDVFRRLTNGEFVGYTSVVTLTETLTLPRRLGNASLETVYQSFLTSTRNLTMLRIDAAIADFAAHLRSRYNLRTPDALQIACAVATGCQAFLTNDNALKRVTNLRILVLSDLTL
jgi:predicted nucleic acid-binding protein